MILISVQPGEEVMKALEVQLADRGIANGAIVSLIGAVEGCCISTMEARNFANDILTEYEGPAELAGTGEIKDGKPHVHVVLGLQGDEAKAGHLHWANVQHFFVNAYVEAL